MSHCHTPQDHSHLPSHYIALAGNPNAGKSVLFQRLTGAYAEVSNYPGTTLDITRGRWGEHTLVDTPGVYGLSNFNPEEAVARDMILGAQCVVNVVNASHLERDLFLTQQLIDAGLPVVVALNMMDEVEALGLHLDAAALSRELGVPVLPMAAKLGRGVKELAGLLPQAATGHATPAVLSRLQEVSQNVPRAEALLILEGDPEVAARRGLSPLPYREELYQARRERVEQIVAAVMKPATREAFTDRLSRWLIRPFPGLLILAAALWLTYQVIGVWVASNVVGLTEETLMQGYYEPFIRGLLGSFLAEESALYRILAGEFGVLTMTLTYVVGLIFPLVTAFYLVLALFEDTGYLPRIAALLDRVMGAIGLNGKAVIPMILGFGCVTMAVITTRMLNSARERRIATYLLTLAVPCSAQLGVITVMLAAVGLVPTLIYAFIMISMFTITGMILDAMLPGESPALFLDLPPLRLPEFKNVLTKTWMRTKHFITEATPLFAIGALILGVLDVTGALVLVQGWVAPLTEGWLGLPREAATAFVMGFVRRDFGAAGLSSMSLSVSQTVAALVTITLFVPCIASALVLLKERGRLEGVIIWVAVLATALFTGGLIHQTEQLGHALTGSLWGGRLAVVLLFAALVAAAHLLARSMRRRRQAALADISTSEAAD